MKDSRDFATEDVDGIEGFATRVLASLVARSHSSTVARRDDLVDALAQGMVTQNEALIVRALTAFRRACISREAMADVYIPAAARQLGCNWNDDSMSFAEVTIASARLQALARAIGARWESEPTAGPTGGSLLLVVPQGEDHTLGAVIATGQMRRLGLSVCLRLRPTPGEVAELVRTRSFDAVFVSLAGGERMESIARLVTSVRRVGGPELPVVIGGSVVSRHQRLVAVTGADHATDDAIDALRFCALLPGPGVLASASLRRTGLLRA